MPLGYSLSSELFVKLSNTQQVIKVWVFLSYWTEICKSRKFSNLESFFVCVIENNSLFFTSLETLVIIIEKIVIYKKVH